MPVEITATGSDANVLQQVASDGGHPVTHQGSNRNRIEQVAADAGLGAVPWLSDAGAIVWLADNLGGGYVSCVYALTVDPLPGEFAATVKPDGITASYVIQGQLALAEAHSVKTVWENYVDISALKVAAQMNVGNFPVLAAIEGVHGGISFVDSTETIFLNVVVVSSPALANGYRLMVVGDGAPVMQDLASKPSVVGVTLDGANDQAIVYVDGVQVATAATAGNGTALPAGVGFMEYSGNDLADAGEEFAITLITNAGDMDLSNFGAGTVDFCSNTVVA